MQIKNKELAFLSLCDDWDYRKNVDMTEPHLQGIAIRDNKILISCEKFSEPTDDYVSCIVAEIEDENMINKFKKLNLKNKGEVIDFISNIEKNVDWKKTSKMLEQEELKLCEEGLAIIESKSLEEWYWYKYDDGSGHLESPNKEEYMSYDLSKFSKEQYLQNVYSNIDNDIERLENEKRKLELDIENKNNILVQLYADKVIGVISQTEFNVIKNSNTIELEKLNVKLSEIDTEILNLNLYGIY